MTTPTDSPTATGPTDPDDVVVDDSGPQTRYPSADELDYARAAETGFVTPSNTVQPNEVYAPFAVEGNDTSAYVGVSPEYMTYASETDMPMRADGGVEADREEAALGNPTPVLVQPAVESQQTEGQGSTHETVYTATSGEGYAAPQAVTENSGDAATEDVTKEENVASPAQAETVTTPTETVEVQAPEVDSSQLQPVPPPPATTGTKKTTSTGTADNATTTSTGAGTAPASPSPTSPAASPATTTTTPSDTKPAT